MKQPLYYFLLFIGVSISINSLGQTDKILWYNQPASYFEESLALGNGKMGASVFGGVNNDKIFLNDATLWSGEPVNPNNNPEAYNYLPAIRQALKDENYKLADSLNHYLQGTFSESYAPLGTMHIHFSHQGEYKNYYRELDISTAVSKVSYQVGDTHFQREYFISHPDQIMVIHLSGNKKNSINCSLEFESLLKYTLSNSQNILEANGYTPYHTEPNYRGDMPNAIQFDENRGTRFTSLFTVKASDGNVSILNNKLEISECSDAVILISVATSFNGFNKNPVSEGLDNQAIAKYKLETASKKSYAELKNEHITDYQSLFNRVSFSLGTAEDFQLPTDKRLMRYSEGKDDKNLEILYFQYGRYLLISSSRSEGVPANLQGIWNPYIRPPWSSNYTLNINAEENYWMAESANLSELHLPLLSFIKNIAETGAITAKNYYNAGGWTACHNSDIWAMSNPVGDFGKGDPNWANWNMAGAWLSTHLWEHYSFTHDTAYLKNDAYPLMKGAVQFCLDWMIQNEKGEWITSPGTSPENLYVTPNGYVGATLYGATADLAMIRELFEDFIAASNVLKINTEFVARVVQVFENLHPYKIGKKGNLQEWYFDWEDAEPLHRHQSHLFGLYPGHHIYPHETPQLAQACRTTLEIKGDETTGWSKGWRINLWARLWDGNRAYKMYRELLRYVDPDGKDINYTGGGGTYPNLFDAHPPFQIDGNFGGSAAVIEMLMQSDENKIYLLPALPETWDEGSIQGICARGGFVVSIAWEKATLQKTEILAKTDGKTILVYGNQQKEIQLKKGESTIINWD